MKLAISSTDARLFCIGTKVPMLCALAVILFSVAFSSAFSSRAYAETRTLNMYFTHTKERAKITFKKNGKYVKSGLRKANRFLRDWRRKEPTRMDPALLDLVWEVYQKSGSRKPIHVISGYRSPRTNKMLRRRGRGVARISQHTLGKALDFFMPDVSVVKLRALGLKAHRGGVGYYRGSFVHMDTGRVRHWPRMNKKQLARVFPRGKTIHVPSNGRPLKGYKTAMANLKKGRNADGSRRSTKVRRTLLAGILSGRSNGRSGDEGENSGLAKRVVAKKVVKKPAKKPVQKKPAPEKPVAVAAAQKPAQTPVLQKQKGPDPFSLENTAAEEVQVASLPQDRVPVPRSRPGIDIPVETQIAALVPVEEATPEPVRATELALVSSVDAGRVPRPPLDIPQVESTPAATITPRSAPVVASAPNPELTPRLASLPAPIPVFVPVPDTAVLTKRSTNVVETAVAAYDISKLRARVESALVRKRIELVPQSDEHEESNARLADALKSVPVPKSPKARSQLLQAALAAAPIDRAKQIVAATTPQWRTAVNDESEPTVVQVEKPSLSVPLPNEVGLTKPEPVIYTEAHKPTTNSLKLGDLEGRSVKKWAVATSTRVGPVAALVAPNYKQGTKRAVPNSVYSVGFAFERSRLRSDRFSGRSLTQVAFAYVGNL